MRYTQVVSLRAPNGARAVALEATPLPPVFVSIRGADRFKVVALTGTGPQSAWQRLCHWLARLLLSC